MERVLTRDVGSYKAGDILDVDWNSFEHSAAQYHGLTGGLDSFSLPVAEAARRYVAALPVTTRRKPDAAVEGAGRRS